MAKMPPLIPVLHRSESLVVRVAQGRYLSFQYRGRQVEFFGPERLRALELVNDGSDADLASLVMHGLFRGASAHGTHPSRRQLEPMPVADVRAAIADLNRHLGLPKAIRQVTVAELEGNPTTYADEWIDVVVRWRSGFELSDCGEKTYIWLDPPRTSHASAERDERFRVVGRFEHSLERGPMRGFGHMGIAHSRISAATMKPWEC